ncbi:MAG: hypothetical protein KAJ19_07400 [Gammaproteobacteria bacterium]|nr:hypothetical protein [Gammaproteobacteria bacterium]
MKKFRVILLATIVIAVVMPALTKPMTRAECTSWWVWYKAPPVGVDHYYPPWNPVIPVGQRGSISWPGDGAVFLAGGTQVFRAGRAADVDTWAWVCPPGVDYIDWEFDRMSATHPRWKTTIGTMVTNNDTDVEWRAPDEAKTGTVTIFEKDDPWPIEECGSGSRTDGENPIPQDSAGISTIIPELYSVTYGADTGAIYAIKDLESPEYLVGVRTHATACWKTLSRAEATASFYSDTDLSDTEQVQVRAETDGDMFNIGDWGDSSSSSWGWGTSSWPTSGKTCVAEMLMDDEVEWRDYSAQWKYKCPNGTDNWIETTNQEGCRLYVVLDHPKTPENPPNEEVLEYATKWADGCETKEEACNDIVGAFSGYEWSGNCDYLASYFVRLVASLGINASQNRWASRDSAYYPDDEIFVGNMISQITKSIDPVGPEAPGSQDFQYHQWAQAEGNQYDPTTASQLDDSDWGDYEDWLYDQYRKCTSLSPYAVADVAAQPGQSSGPEAPAHRHYASPETLPWEAP